MSDATSTTLAALLASYTVEPDPPEAEFSDAEDRRRLMFATMCDRGCPLKLSREVSGMMPDHRCESGHAIDAVLQWLDLPVGAEHRESIVLSGERGRGKSYSAAQALVRVRPGQGCPRWAKVLHVAAWLHARGQYESARRGLARIEEASLLVLDDMGWEYLDKAGYVRSALIGIIDDRIQAERRNILTTSLDEKQFCERYGDAIHDRLRGYGLWVDVERGPSMR